MIASLIHTVYFLRLKAETRPQLKLVMFQFLKPISSTHLATLFSDDTYHDSLNLSKIDKCNDVTREYNKTGSRNPISKGKTYAFGNYSTSTRKKFKS